ncbi:thiosulfate:glutathione sulfurtransferase-like [Branchiostoma lanceolatum]|uniref:thiosulfate:glutathione sulfurtransferase-like n=1 Tax=Branchiostoma lanceolatum TaxID=7740 RepID=UPI0034548DB1
MAAMRPYLLHCLLFLAILHHRPSSGSESWQDTDMPYDELKARLGAGTVRLFDVREPIELVEDGEIPGAVNIPLGEVEEAFQLPPGEFRQKYNCEKPGKDDDDIVTSCLAGVRSFDALEQLRKLGFHKVKHYPGGFIEWSENCEQEWKAKDETRNTKDPIQPPAPVDKSENGNTETPTAPPAPPNSIPSPQDKTEL